MRLDAGSVKGHLRTLLLAVIAEEPAHGYTVIERLRARSSGALDLPEGTIYPALHRLENDGLLRSSWEKQAGRERRVYTITAKGKRALADGRRVWSFFSRTMEASLGGTDQ